MPVETSTTRKSCNGPTVIPLHYHAGVADHLLYVTQVAPYVDGPAGVHGVLSQSATALAELTEAAGLGFQHVEDVRRLPIDDLASARVVALFTIGETPWSAAQRAALLDGARSGRTAVVAIH